MVDIISTGFIFGVGFVCGSCSALVLGGKVLEFCRFGLFGFGLFVISAKKMSSLIDQAFHALRMSRRTERKNG